MTKFDSSLDLTTPAGVRQFIGLVALDWTNLCAMRANDHYAGRTTPSEEAEDIFKRLMADTYLARHRARELGLNFFDEFMSRGADTLRRRMEAWPEKGTPEQVESYVEVAIDEAAVMADRAMRAVTAAAEAAQAVKH